MLEKDRGRVLSCLTPEIVAILLEDNRTIVEIHDGKLLVASGIRYSPSRYEAFLQRANRIAKAFEQVGNRASRVGKVLDPKSLACVGLTDFNK